MLPDLKHLEKNSSQLFNFEKNWNFKYKQCNIYSTYVIKYYKDLYYDKLNLHDYNIVNQTT